MDRIAVGIVVFPEVEVLDFAGPFEVFSVTRLDEDTRYSDRSPFDVSIVGETAGAIAATGGLRVLPTHTLDTCPPLDVLVVPGGLGTRVQVENPRLIAWILDRAGRARTVASVCTGSFLLAHAGLLEGLRATTHWRSLDRMEQAYPGVQVERGLHVVDEGSVLTSAGISAGIDMALRVVGRYCGEAVARATARHMEYPYPETNERRIRLGP